MAKETTRSKIMRFLPRIKSVTTYGALAEKVGSAPMAVGQLLKAIHAERPEFRKYTRRVKSAKFAKAA